jgi:hypothetical protein
MTSRIRALCADCQIDTLRRGADWYIVHNHVWECAWPGAKTTFAVREQSNDEVVPFSEILCIDCLKRRLGRDLTPDDFTDVPVNDAVLKRLFK